LGMLGFPEGRAETAAFSPRMLNHTSASLDSVFTPFQDFGLPGNKIIGNGGWIISIFSDGHS
jgi:hypothetical protein